MEDEGITYDDIAGGYFADNIECEIVGSTAWHLRSQWKDWDDRTQAVVKQIKSWVNGVTKNYISERLKDNGIPASYDTAFYLKYYPQVNAVMKDVAERII